jgi:HD-GYP domain-containing protein (c-di-GMP phosphodiesterase class II)
MNPSRRSDGADQAYDAQPEADDPVLTALRQADLHYRETYRALQQQRDELAATRADNERLSSQLVARQAEVDGVRRHAEHQRERADVLANALGDVHRALFRGNVYDLILKTCVTLTGATRGQYLATSGPDLALHVRATVDLDAAARSPLAECLTGLCREVIQSERVVLRNNLADVLDRPEHARLLRNCIAAPVVLRSKLSGVIVVADKAAGDFDEQDAETLLSVGSQAAVAVENARLQHEVQDTYLSIVGLLVDAIAARNPQLPQQQLIASRRARALAEQLGLPDYEQSIVYYAMLLRDIGNIGVSDGVLNKPGPLLDAERELIRSHAQIGHDLLQQVPLLHGVAKIIRHHHERYDGTGYPDHLQGEAIPIAARIVAVVDAYTAMLATRSYRPALTEEQACLELQRGAGIQFDARVVETFLTGLGSRERQASAGDDDGHDVALPGLDAHSEERLDLVSPQIRSAGRSALKA